MSSAAEPLPPQAGIHHGSPVAIALDLGGTRLKGGLVGPGGTHAYLQARDTRAEAGYEAVLKEMLRLVEDLRAGIVEQDLTLVGLGVGAPGPLNRATGVIEFAPNLKWRQVPLGTDLARLSGIDFVRLENDANAATFAESWIGESSGARCLLGITLGTGVGGGLVIDGRLFAGAGGIAAEPGHIVVDPQGPPCRCGNRGCVEAFFSAGALVGRCRDLAAEHPGHGLALDGLRPEDVFAAAARGDPLAARVVEEGVRALGLAVAGAINLINPDRVAFLGGLAASWDLFGPALLEHVRRYAIPAAFAGVQFAASKLTWAGVLGAGGLLLTRSPDL